LELPLPRQTLIVPLENTAEAAAVEGVGVCGASSLSQAAGDSAGCQQDLPHSRFVNGSSF
jgi:hypothetical protein